MKLYDTYSRYLSELEQCRWQEQEKLFAYYFGNQSQILEYLEQALSITFNSDDIQEMQKDWINITTKCIDQMSVVYRDPAKRELIKDETDKELTEYFNNKLFAVNTSDKTAHRFAKLANTSLTKVSFEEGKIKYTVLPSYLYSVKTDENNFYKLKEVAYPYNFIENGKSKLYVVVWTDTEHYRAELLTIDDLNIRGNKEVIPNMTDTINPYGVIPYAVLRLKEQGDFWGNGQTDVVNGNEQINLLLTELTNEHVLMGAAGTLLAVNLDLKAKDEEGQTIAKKVRTGRKHPITIENASGQNEKAPPSLEYIGTNPFIMELKELVDWKIKLIAITKGMNPNSFLADVQATSGYSKVIDSIEQLELRQDDIEPCRIYEDERFNISRIINNVHCGTTDKTKYNLQIIPDDIYLKVDFAEIKPPKTIDETIKETDYLLQHNLTNIVDIKREMNPDLTDEEIEQELETNKEINDRFIVQDNPVDKVETGFGNHFKQNDNESCGLCSIKSIMSMYGMEYENDLDTSEGLSPEKIMNELNANGLHAEIIRGVKLENIKPKSIAYYKDMKHYVTIEKVSKDKLYVNDSLKDMAEWITKKDFDKLWEQGWLIQTKRNSGS